MNILAVYDHEQLELPSKVLTHREDIDPLLSVLGVRLESLEPQIEPGQQCSNDGYGAYGRAAG